MTDDQGSIVARFEDIETANRALRNLRDAQQSKGLEIREGAVVVGTADGVMPIMDIDDVGLCDVTSNALDLMVFLGIGAVKIAAEAALSGGALLLSSGRRAFALGGSLLMLPAKTLFAFFESEQAIENLGKAIEPGVCAVIAVVDHVADRAQVMAELSESGGEIVEIEEVEEEAQLDAI